MNSPYGSHDNYQEEWIDPGWCEWDALESSFVYPGYQHDLHLAYAPVDDLFYPGSATNLLANGYRQHQPAVNHAVPQAGPVGAAADTSPAALFHVPLGPRVNPPYAPEDSNIQQQKPRFEGDQYTAPFVRGQGIERAGWCGYCCTWHKMKDSAFWYHMHYSHGISCTTGQPFSPPKVVQVSDKSNSLRIQCATCNEWMTVGTEGRARTSYYRHAYKCGLKKQGGRPQTRRSSSRR